MGGPGRDLWRSSHPSSQLTAGPNRAGCSGLCPPRFWILPRMERPQPAWTKLFMLSHPSGKKIILFLCTSAWGYSSPAAGLGISLCRIPRDCCWPISPACWCPPEWSHSHLVYQLVHQLCTRDGFFVNGGFSIYSSSSGVVQVVDCVNSRLWVCRVAVQVFSTLQGFRSWSILCSSWLVGVLLLVFVFSQ